MALTNTTNLRKLLRFGLYGAVGCLAAALCFGEVSLTLLMPANLADEKPQVDVMFVVDATSSMQYAIDGTREGIQRFAAQLSDGDSELDARTGLIAFRDRVWSPPQVDVMFVLDVSGSMQGEIDGVRNGIQSFASELGSSGLDVRVGLLAFRNRTAGEEPQVLQVGDETFTKDYGAFSRQVRPLRATGGGGTGESSFDALALAARQSFRGSAAFAKDANSKLDHKSYSRNPPTKILILITDEPPESPDREIRDARQLNDVLREQRIDQLHLIIDSNLRGIFEQLRDSVPTGQFFDLQNVSRGDVSFDRALPEVAKQITTTFESAAPIDDRGPSPMSLESVSTEPEIISFGDQAFTSDVAEFRRQASRICAGGGGDTPESSLDALSLAARQAFRPESTKAIVLVTDAPPHVPDREIQAPNEVTDILRNRGIDQLHLVVMNEDLNTYESLWNAEDVSGKFFSLADAATGRQEFDAILPEVGREIAMAIGGVGSSQRFAKGQMGRLLTAYAVWTGLLAIGVTLALIVGQNMSTRRRWLGLIEATKGGLGSIVAGAGAGVAGQLLFQLAARTSEETLSSILWAGTSRVVAWTILGAALGAGMSLFVPNLKWHRALFGGALGGSLGALGFLSASAVAGDISGRLAGAAVLGFFIGLMVALAELAFRGVWLEVAFGPREMTTVTLGSRPVSVGSDASCTVCVPSAPPVAYKYQIEDKLIFCNDVASRQTSRVGNGDQKTLGDVTLTVRTSDADISSASTFEISTPPPPPVSRGTRPQASVRRPSPTTERAARQTNSANRERQLPPPPPPRPKRKN